MKVVPLDGHWIKVDKSLCEYMIVAIELNKRLALVDSLTLTLLYEFPCECQDF